MSSAEWRTSPPGASQYEGEVETGILSSGNGMRKTQLTQSPSQVVGGKRVIEELWNYKNDVFPVISGEVIKPIEIGYNVQVEERLSVR